ncbi:hypothetical protein E0H49_35275 [Rhizobium leguminosarum bv. viciae]|nr:hypothetical protein E0H49_35275 [Rhizobium leguminosarum bv. viciae]TCB15574.1 hypothetical protein E0J09_33915 [Rhizobium leguminosarum bv. viciae]
MDLPGGTAMIRLVILLAVGAYVSLVATSSGVLVGSTITPPAKAGDQAKLDCRYFTGFAIAQRPFWYLEGGSGMWGIDTCPRIIKL